MKKGINKIGIQFFAVHAQRLNANTVYASLFNLIRLVGVLGAKLQIDDSNATRFKMEGGRYEDTLYWVSCDVLSSYVFDPDDTNVLTPGNKVTPAYKTITVDQVRQISLYLPTYFLSSQAFQSAGYFDEFTALAQSMIQKTRKLYDQRLVDTYIGTTVSSTGKQSQTVTLQGAGHEQEDTLAIAEKVSNILFEMADTTRSYNDRQYMSAFGKEAVDIIWNSTYYSKMMKVGLPVTFNKDGVLENGRTLPNRYFGIPITTSNYSTYSASTPAAGKPIDSDDGTYVPGSNNANGTLRALEEQDITVSAVVYHVFPGDELPAGAVVYASSEVQIPCYIEDADVICKIISKDACKYVSSIETQTEFVNGKNHSRNMWLTFMYAKPDRLPEETWTTLKKA